MFVGSNLLSHAAWATIQSELPDNIYVKRMPSGWNNTHEHCVIIRLLSLVLQPLRGRYQLVLIFDAVPLHLADAVMAELKAEGFWYLVIPARLTWLLQPLDTHTFAKFKRHLRIHHQDAASAPSEPNVTLRMLRLVIGAIRGVLQSWRWDRAFASNGLAGDQDMVSSFIKNQLEYQRLPPYPPARPTAESLRECWPRSRVVNENAVWGPLPGLVLAAAPGMLGPPPAVALAPGPPGSAGPPALPDELAPPAVAGAAASSGSAGASASASEAAPPFDVSTPTLAPRAPRTRRRQKSSQG